MLCGDCLLCALLQCLPCFACFAVFACFAFIELFACFAVPTHVIAMAPMSSRLEFQRAWAKVQTHFIPLAEIFNPEAETWTTTDSISVGRNYHSVAVLLQDGRVFSGGGGLCGGCNTNHFDGQIFTPPQLLNADGSTRARPAITISSATATNGATLTVTVTANGPLARIAILRCRAARNSVLLCWVSSLWLSCFGSKMLSVKLRCAPTAHAAAACIRHQSNTAHAHNAMHDASNAARNLFDA